MFAQPPVPRTAMEQSGHAQVPTLLVALVRRQAGRAGWIAKIGSKNTENQKFETDRRYQFQGFAFQNTLKGLRRSWTLKNIKTVVLYRFNTKFAVFSTFWISKMVCFKRALRQKERNVDIRYHTESQGLRIQRVL